MTTLASALARCLHLMDRAAPHPHDTDSWRDTIRQASIILAREQPVAQPSGKSFWRWAAWLATAFILGHHSAGDAARPASSQDRVTWPNPFRDEMASVLSLAPTTTPGAVAEVRFLNQDVHAFPTATFDLTRDGLTVSVTLDINQAGGTPDRITVTPPAGFLAIPPSLTVPEGETATIAIYPTDAATS